MDDDITVAWPLAVVFGLLATPARLAEWLPGVVAVHADTTAPAGLGTQFALRIRDGDREIPGTGELIGYEPPWSAAYRLITGPVTQVLRLTCTAIDGATRVHIRQAGGPAQLSVDPASLRRFLAGAHPAAATPRP
jgi:uncharacterized protein YndB with AHSA1/START domain